MASGPRRTTIDTLRGEWLASRRSENTRIAYAADLDRFLTWCGAQGIDPLTADVRSLRRYRSAVERSGVSAATTARRLSAVASFGDYAARRGAGTTFSDVARPTVGAKSATEVLDDRDAAALIRAADGMAPRSAVLVRLLMLDGLKVGEAAAADAADVSGRPPAMVLRVGAREIRLDAETSTLVHAYLSRRRSGPLLLSEGRARRSDRLSRFGIDYMIKEVARVAGVTGPVSGNMLRRRYVVAAHAGGDSVEDIQRQAGHVDVRTTRRYLEEDPDHNRR